MRRWIWSLAAVLILAGAGIWLWRWSGDDEIGLGLLGGPLFSFSVDQVEALEIRRLDGTTWLQMDDDGAWVLTGLVTDIVDPDRVHATLSALSQGIGFPLLLGTQPDERRFGFGGPQALELVFHLRGDERQRLALGDHNPATEMFYASGAGRPGVFGIGGALYATASRLPGSVRMPRLLPQLRAADLDSLHLGRRDNETLFFARLDDDRWWMRHPARSSALVGKAARYHERYEDRRIEHGGSVWLLANEWRLRDLVYGTTGATVTILGPDQQAQADLTDEGLLPPYRTLDLWVRGGPSYRVEFGDERPWESGHYVVSAIRQGAAMVLLRPQTLLPLLGPVSDFLDLEALSFHTEIADSFRIDEPERPLLWARRAADPVARRLSHLSIWDPVVPPGWALSFDGVTTAHHLTDLQAAFDRLECLRVMDPEPLDPLDAGDRWRLRSWLPGQQLHEVWFGRLRSDRRPVAWSPADGKCLEVPEQILMTLRNMRLYLTKEGSLR